MLTAKMGKGDRLLMVLAFSLFCCSLSLSCYPVLVFLRLRPFICLLSTRALSDPPSPHVVYIQ